MFISKYGVARHIYIPIVKRAVVDFAVGADWTPAAGDVKISKDGGAAANVTNLPTAIAMGNGAIWDFSLTATEMQAAQVMVTVADSATKAVEDQSFVIETHGHASAQFQVDLADGVRAGLTSLPNAAAEAAGGLYTRGSGAGQITQSTNGQVDVDAKKWNGLTTVALPLIPTVAGRTLDCSAGGEAGLDWANIGSPTTAQGLTGTTISVTQVIASVSGAVASVTGAVGSVTAGVTLAASAVQAIWDALTTALTTAGSIGKRLADFITGDAYVRLGAPAGASVSADIAAINAKTTNLPGSPAAVGSAMTLTSGERDSVADALLDRANGVETSLTVRGALRLTAAALAGKLSGAATTTVTIRNVPDTKARITATVDVDGNRSAVTTDAT